MTSKTGAPESWHPKKPSFKSTLGTVIILEHGNKLHPHGFLRQLGSHKFAFKNVNIDKSKINIIFNIFVKSVDCL